MDMHRVGVFLREEDGPTAVEYALMLALVVMVCLGSIAVLGKAVEATFNALATAVNSI